MKLQVLVSTMNQNDHSILRKMNIRSDAIIVNQCNENRFEKFSYNGNTIHFLSFNERGVGLSRNNALMRASADICLFADDDVTYVDEYKKIICDAFKKNPSADLIIFNVPSTNPDRQSKNIKKNKRTRWFNSLKYGAVRIAIRTDKIKQSNIYFSLLFGGGAKYSAGEDSLFIAECFKKNLKIYVSPKVIGYVSQEGSTWFKGYTDKYFKDKGVFYYCLSKHLSKPLCLQYCLRHKNLFERGINWKQAYKLMCLGIKEFKRCVK